jgi:predicted HAD superfamily Cof-like phosphohydrolase
MTPEQTRVKQWMADFGQETPDKPCIPDLETRKLRARLILEECLETIRALGVDVETAYPDLGDTRNTFRFYEKGEPNLHEIADGLADLHVVAYCGTGVACGLDMEKVMERVLVANESKMWTVDEINEKFNCYPDHSLEDKTTKEKFTLKFVTAKLLKNNITKFYIVKDSSGKVIKPPSFTPPSYDDMF